MDLDAIEQYVGVPVSIQLKGPLANHGSLEQIDLGSGVVCGRAAMAETDGKIHPITVWAGTVNSVCEVGLVFDTLGFNDVPLRVFVPYDLVAGIFFAIRHVAPAEPSRIALS